MYKRVVVTVSLKKYFTQIMSQHLTLQTALLHTYTSTIARIHVYTCTSTIERIHAYTCTCTSTIERIHVYTCIHM